MASESDEPSSTRYAHQSRHSRDTDRSKYRDRYADEHSRDSDRHGSRDRIRDRYTEDRSRGSENEKYRNEEDHRRPSSYTENDRGHGSRHREYDRGRERNSSRDDDWAAKNSRPDFGREMRRQNSGKEESTAPPKLYTVCKGKVHSIKPFGVFVHLDGFRNHGLVHVSQISAHEISKRDDSDEQKVKAISSIVDQGEDVWVKVVSVKNEEDGNVKIGCSMKCVSQADGRDLDPNNIELEMRQAKPGWQAPQKVTLDAVYNVACPRCGGHGHLKNECYSGGKVYELLPEDDADINPGEGTVEAKDYKSTIPSGVGRGRAMVQPAWMTHGIGQSSGGEGRSKVYNDNLPNKITTVEEARAVIAQLEEEKKRRKEKKRSMKKEEHKKKHHKDKKHKKDKHRESKKPRKA